MDIRNGQITVGQIMSHPQARQIALREFPMLRNPRVMGMARGMTLNRVMQMGRGRIPQSRMNALLQQLREI